MGRIVSDTFSFFENRTRTFSKNRIKYSYENVHSTCDELSNFHVVGLPQQTNKGRDAITVLNGHLVLIVFAIRDVSQRATSLAVHFRLGMIQKSHKYRDPLQLAHVLLNLIVLIAQVLQVGSSVGFHWINRVSQHGNDLWEIRVPPTWVLADAVDGRRTSATHSIQTGHAPPLRLSKWC